jgi:hypothetical protein
MNMKLTKYYESSCPIAYAWNAHTALVQIERWVVALVPNEGEHLEPFTEERAERFRPLIEDPSDARASMRLGELTVWASRRVWVARYAGERGNDPQLVLGAVFSRLAIRESLQWLMQNRVSSDAIVEVESVPVSHTEACGTPAHVLRMRCDRWMGIVMCHAPGSLHGGDPLFVEVDGDTRATGLRPLGKDDPDVSTDLIYATPTGGVVAVDNTNGERT